MCFQGQVPGLDGYLISAKDGIKILEEHPSYNKVLKPHLIAEELLASVASQPQRFIIDFTGIEINEASAYKQLFKILEKEVLPERKKFMEWQEEENKKVLKRNPKAKVNTHHIHFYNRWWQLAYGREDMLERFETITRYIACSGVSKRDVFEFVSTAITPNAAVFAFAFDDDYSFGIIQSKFHWDWWRARCSTFEARFRYTANTVWDTFPFPQHPTQIQAEAVAKAAVGLRAYRNKMIEQHRLTLRELYTSLETPGKNPLKDLHAALDEAVMQAYGFSTAKDILTQLLQLNLEVAALEAKEKEVTPPGLPSWIKNREQFVTEDCVRLRVERSTDKQ